jgi:hypothetical protein
MKLANLTRAEAEALIEAVSQMTGGNAYDYASWKECTSGTRKEWRALLRGEAKLIEFVKGDRR